MGCGASAGSALGEAAEASVLVAVWVAGELGVMAGCVVSDAVIAVVEGRAGTADMDNRVYAVRADGAAAVFEAGALAAGATAASIAVFYRLSF